jgi:hypothetical protein
VLVALFFGSSAAVHARAGSLSFSVDLRSGVSDASAAPHIVAVEPPADANRDGWYETVLRISLDDPRTGKAYNTVEFQVEYDAEPAGQVTVNIGDSRTNDSGGGDAGTQSNDAEICVGNAEGASADLYVFGKDGTPNPGPVLEHIPGFAARGVARFIIKDQHVSWENHRGRCGSLSSPYLFALGGQADTEGPVNREIYAAFNRVIAGPRRFGTGVRRVTVILTSDSPAAGGLAAKRPEASSSGMAGRGVAPRTHDPAQAASRAADELPVGEPRTIRLPAVADHVLAAGAGRYLVVQFSRLMKLGIYDVAQDKFTGYIPLPSSEVAVACGLHHVVVVATDKKVVQRYGIDPPRKELTVSLDVPQPIEGVVMGHASEGPILVTTSGAPRLVSLQTLRPLGLSLDGRADWSGRVVGAASADGQTFAGWARGVSPSGVRRLQIEGNRLVGRYDHTSAGHVVPSWDGTYLFGSQVIYDSVLQPVGGERFRGNVMIPALHPAYFLAIPMPDRFGTRGRTAPAGPSIYTVADRTKLLDLDPLSELQPEGRSTSFGYVEDLPMSERIFLAPQHGRLVTLARPRDSLVARKFDIIAAMDRAGIDYLFVDSTPPLLARPGETYRYAIQVKSKSGGVEFTLDSGPEGMTLSKDGMLRWEVPAGIEVQQHGVIITVKDASGQTLLHSFTIRTVDPAPLPGRPPAKQGSQVTNRHLSRVVPTYEVPHELG